MSKKLEEIRKKIDTLDDRIHDALMERAALIVDIAEEKRKHKMQYVQPAREAKMIRRLLDRHQGALPQAAIIRIWRELVGAVSLLQTGLKVSVYTGEGQNGLWDMAKDYFGSVVPMQRLSSPLVTVSSVRENESSFAVLPWPSDEDQNPWWVYVFNQDEPVKVVCALPYGHRKNEKLSNQEKALVISKIDFSESGDDHSFVVFETDSSVSRGRIVDVLKDLKMEPLGINSVAQPGNPYTLHLVEVNRFLDAQDKIMDTIQKKFEGHCNRCDVLGGYPVPPVYSS